jgi:hypothetical protein
MTIETTIENVILHMGRTISTRNGIGLSKVKQLSRLVLTDFFPESLTATKQTLAEVNRCVIFRSTDE